MTLERAAIAVLVLVVAGQQLRSCVDARARRAERLAAANQLATSAVQQDWLSGQLRVAARYLVQGQVQLDQTQRDRDQQAVLAVGLRVQVDALRGRVDVAPQLSDSGVRVVSGWGRLPIHGVHVESDVLVRGVAPIAGQEPAAVVGYRVQLAPVDLRVGLSCEGANARVLVTGPRWSTLTLSPGTISAAVCNPAPPAWRPFTLRAPSLPWAAGLVGLGYILNDILR